jgi:hypothetical protein
MWLDADNAPRVPLKTAANFHLAFFQELIAVLPVVKSRIAHRLNRFAGTPHKPIRRGAPL